MTEPERLSEGLLVRHRRCRICGARANTSFTIILRLQRFRRRYIRACSDHGTQLGSAVAAVAGILREQRILQRSEEVYAERGARAD